MKDYKTQNKEKMEMIRSKAIYISKYSNVSYEDTLDVLEILYKE